MKYTEIIKLLDAGYTREEILNMDEPEETKPEETKPEETKPKETKPKETKPEETKPEETENTPSSEILGELKELFTDMRKEFTAMNIMNSRRDSEAKTGEDIIANIINPFDRKEK